MSSEHVIPSGSLQQKTGNRYLLYFILPFLWFLLVPNPVGAQEELTSKTKKLPREAPSLRFENIGLIDGLQQGSVHDIMQDSDGYLWMTTQDGLHRYDGYEFKAFNTTPFDTTSLSSSYVHMVEEASDGGLWVTASGGGLNKMDKSTGTFKHYKHVPGDTTSLSTNNVFDVKESREGELWISSFGGGLNFMPAGEDGKFQHLRHDPDDENTLTSDVILLISEDANGDIWAGSPTGLNKIDSKTHKVTRYLYKSGITANDNAASVVSSVYHPPGDKNTAWLATGLGLVRLNTETGDHERFIIEENDPDNRLNHLYNVVPDPSEPQILWVSGPGTGIARFDITTGQFTTYRHDPRDPHSLGEDETFALFADKSGTMWVGHHVEGVSKFNPRAINFYHLQHDPEDPNSLAFGPVWGLYEDSQQTLWAGTSTTARGEFLTRIETDGKITRYKGRIDDPQTLPPGNFTSFAEDQQDRFWIGGQGGLNFMDRKTGKVTRFTHLPFPENAARNNITSLVLNIKEPDLLWIATAAGLEVFNTTTNKFSKIELPVENQKEQPVVYSLLYSKDNTLWVGTTAGLFNIDQMGNAKLASKYDPGDTTTISSNKLYAILEREGEPGILWVGTSGGLNRFDSRTGIATHYMTKDGLPNEIIYGILEDSNGTLWMSTNHGISNFDPEAGTFRNYGLDDGLAALEYDQYAYAKGSDGMMYFGSMEGVTAFIPEKLAINETPPQVMLSGLKLFNKPVLPGPESPLKKSLSETNQLILDHDQKEITFDFVALHYGNPNKNSYAYMLDGFDKDWVDAGNKRSATYTNLSPGSYTFKVKAANADGVWSQENASVQLTVLPPWYQTWWAYTLFALLLILTIFAVDRFQRHQIKKKEKERATLREAELRAEAENRRRADTEQLSKIGKAITSTLSITNIIETVYEHVNELMDASIFGIGIYNAEKDRLDFPATKEKGVMLSPYSHRLTEENRLAVHCFNNNIEIILGDTAKESRQYTQQHLPPVKGDESRSLIYLPLVQQGRTIGVITTQSFNEKAYTPYHVHLLRNLATYAAIALDNASAYRQLDATLSDLKLMQEQLVQQEKLASLGQLTAGIAHEIKNPLNFVNNFSELSVELIDEAQAELVKARTETTNENLKLNAVSDLLEDIEINLKKIFKHGTRADGIVRSMLQHSRGGTGKMEPVDLNELIKEYVNLSFHGMRAGKDPINVELDLQLDEKVDKLPLIEEDFSRVILNLCNNSFEAMREKTINPQVNGTFLPKLTVRTQKHKNRVTIDFEDNGPGIPEEIQNKILQPFFTTKKGTAGTGLGLSITHDIIKSHGGILTLKSSEATGTCFTVEIPTSKTVELKAV